MDFAAKKDITLNNNSALLSIYHLSSIYYCGKIDKYKIYYFNHFNYSSVALKHTHNVV